MKKNSLLFIIGLNVFAATAQDHRTIPFDKDWKFKKSSIAGAENAAYDDTGWRVLDLPHDWSMEDLPNQVADSITGPFDKASIGTVATGFTVGGTGWYRKQFVSEQSFQNRIVTIHFDGVYMNSDVWLNGHHLGNHPYGYTPFNYELTAYLMPPGQENVLVVRVKNPGKNSRWYSGSGIYRHVWLSITHPVHVNNRGVYITTPQVSNNSATVRIKTAVSNRQSAAQTIRLVTTLISPAGNTVSQSKVTVQLAAGVSLTDSQSIRLANPVLWSVETPRLYKAITEIKQNNTTLDRVETVFGIRSLSFTAETGFLLNGKRVLLKGGCVHHDNGPLGAATIDRAEERKIEVLKKNGFNAIRTSHNPPSQQLLDACDRLGMLVLDEAFDMWERGKNSDDYHLYFKDWWQKDIDAMVLRDRNHPSVIFWSIGNEINERADSSGLRIARQLSAEIRQLDNTRPVTQAICFFWDHPGYKWDTSASAFAVLDVGGYNYLSEQYESDHRKFPQRMMMGTESYPVQALENWNLVEKHPYVLGDFVWTAIDYLGEASIGHATIDSTKKYAFQLDWPWFNSYCGDIDLTGDKKSPSYYRDIVWRNKPIAMAVHAPIPDGMIENVSFWGWPDEQQNWTWPGAENKPLQVRVFSRAPMVRLRLNGKIIGEQKLTDTNITAVFNVPYQPGTLKAVNVINDKETDAVEF
ncbi:MAG TPA: glycoside hydrolase family 2 TIM barrel-domain containing protein, partial [Chitinophagaceae bacterium]|nr:glycoside hydrolase family 2 TIM barrel-domain containing protein [Chitinophagaceae bacterium]